jgi:hypothetical protein
VLRCSSIQAAKQALSLAAGDCEDRKALRGMKGRGVRCRQAREKREAERERLPLACDLEFRV